MLIVDRENSDEVWIPNLGDRLLTIGENCWQLCDYNDFEAIAPGRKPGFIIVVSGRTVAVCESVPDPTDLSTVMQQWKRRWQGHCI